MSQQPNPVVVGPAIAPGGWLVQNAYWILALAAIAYMIASDRRRK